MKKADIGLVGLAVMGENLVMNMESKGFTVAVFNRTTEKVKKAFDENGIEIPYPQMDRRICTEDSNGRWHDLQ